MKFYMHCEKPEFTVVLKLTPTSETFQHAIDIFKKKLCEKYPSLDASVIELCAKNCKGKQINTFDTIKHSVQEAEDIFIDIIDKSPATQVVAAPSKKVTEIETDQQSQGMINAAMIHVGNERYRKAIEIYKDILKKYKNHTSALQGLVQVYLRADRPRQALKYTEMGMRAFPENVEFMVLAGECYIGCKDAEAALDTLMKCVKYARSKGGMGKEEKQNIQLLLAKAYLLKNEKDMAITVLQGILRENLDNDDALTEYAQLLFSLGPEQCEEAMTVILGVLARKQGDKRAKEVFAEMMRDAKGMEVLKKAAKSVFNDSAALVYLASCLRDHSVINSSLELFENALEISPNDPSIALIYIHTLEVIDNHIKILNFAQDFMKRYDSPGIGCMMHSCLNTIYDIIFSNILSGTGDKIELAKELDFETPTPEASYTYTDDDRYFLAFVFTVVKVLFVNGHLCGIPWLLKVMSSFYQGRDLHKSNIRNEAAYFNCIHEIMKTFSDHLPDLRAVPDDNVLYFVGDSHCIPAAWQTLNAQDHSYIIKPVLSTGTKIWHLQSDCTFYPKANFFSVVKRIPKAAKVVFGLGEIDCREALLKCWEKARYDRIEDGMEAVIDIYLQVLKDLQREHGWQIYVHPLMPVLDLTRPIVVQFNRLLATKLLREQTLHWLNFVNELLTEDGNALKAEYVFDGTHVHPCYVSLLQNALAEYNL